MPAPTKDKTWQFNVNQMFFAATALATHQQVLFAIKEALKGFGSTPWTVQGSSSSAASGMDAVDRWAASTNLVWAAGAHSWIVIRQTGIAAKFEVCFDLNIAQDQSMTVVVSPVNGFGTANGGTNGTTSARPTATDEIVILNQGSWISGSSNLLNIPHVMQSTDGQCTRVVVASGNNPCTLMVFDRAKTPIGSWTGTTALFGIVASNNQSNIITYTNFLDSAANVFFRHSSTNGNFFMATVGYQSAAHGRNLSGAVLHDVTKEWPMTPITLWSESTNLRGLWGNMFDLYWGSDDVNSLVSYESGGTPFSWHQFGHMVFPWNGTTAAKMG